MPKKNNPNKKNSKGNVKGSGKHANMAFSDMVGKANTEQLKTYVQQLISYYNQQYQNQINGVLNHQYSRILNLEDILKEKFEMTQEDISDRLNTLEDAKNGLEEVDEVKVGDTVRCTVAVKKDDSDEFDTEENLVIDNINLTPFSVDPKIEEALLGFKKGDETQVEIDLQETKKMVKVKVVKISRKIVVEEPKEEEKEETDENTNG